MRQFQRLANDGIILDDIRDMEFLARHQHVLQGKHDARAEFASTPGGQCAFRRWLYRVPFVATANYSTANLKYLRAHDRLSKPVTCVVLELREAPLQPSQGSAPQQDEQLAGRTACSVTSGGNADLDGCRCSGVLERA